MSVFLVVLTYIAYIFIIVMYTVKAIKIARMPAHLRWELYPVIYEPKSQYGSAYQEDEREWRKSHRQTLRKGILYLLKENLRFSEYFKSNRGYWLALFPWHIGFILIITFHILCFFGAVVMVAGIPVSAESAYVVGKIFYYCILITGVFSFIAGAFGSIGLIIKRLSDKDLKAFAAPQNYFNYIFTLVVFLSGLYAWIFVDPAFSQYREFWRGLVTLNPASVEPATAAHIILFSIFLIYLPFTRSMHYITKFFAFLWVKWDDRPNFRGSQIENNIKELLDKPVSWSAPHIPQKQSWAEIASGKVHDEEKS
jgi:nitrate reductase gamma subunit